MRKDNPYLNRDIETLKRPQRIIALSGPPAIGKTTFINEVKKMFTDEGLPEPPVVSPDAFIYEGGIYQWSPARAREAWRKAYRKLENVSIRSVDCPIIFWDATLCHGKARRALLREWGHLTRAGSRHEILELPSPGYEVLVERDSERTPDRQIGEEVIKRMFNQYMNRDDRPTEKEGWKAIWRDPEAFKADLRETVIQPIFEERRKKLNEEAFKDIEISDEDFNETQYPRR